MVLMRSATSLYVYSSLTRILPCSAFSRILHFYTRSHINDITMQRPCQCLLIREPPCPPLELMRVIDRPIAVQCRSFPACMRDDFDIYLRLFTQDRVHLNNEEELTIGKQCTELKTDRPRRGKDTTKPRRDPASVSQKPRQTRSMTTSRLCSTIPSLAAAPRAGCRSRPSRGPWSMRG